jgi:hypothetical protein
MTTRSVLALDVPLTAFPITLDISRQSQRRPLARQRPPVGPHPGRHARALRQADPLHGRDRLRHDRGFGVGNAATSYTLSIGVMDSGTIGDALTSNAGRNGINWEPFRGY